MIWRCRKKQSSAPHHHGPSTTQLGTVQLSQLLLSFNNLSRIMVVFRKNMECRKQLA